MKAPENDFARSLTTFLGQYLPGQRNASRHTVAAYRDTFKLFLRYCQSVHQIRPDQLRLHRLTQALVLGFLDWLEAERQNTLATRNQRLAALRAFCLYVQPDLPEHLDEWQRILAIPSKKTPRPLIPFLTTDEMRMVLQQPRPGTRDQVLLATLYDSGARVQELLDLTAQDIRLAAPAVVTLHGKGRKSRHVPLMPNTRQLLADYLKTARRTPGYANPPIFLNQYGTALTRRGVSYLVDKYVQQASTVPGFQVHGRITPHVFRHSRAVHMLQAGINLVYIRDFLGHATVTTTEIYARADTEMKRQALERVDYGFDAGEMPGWDRDGELMAWLEDLCR